MKRYLLLFSLILSSQFAMAQQCTPDADATTWGIHPLPSVTTGGFISVPEIWAVPGEYYEYTFSYVIPGSFNVGAGDLGVTKATITSVDDLPAGLSFGECSSSSGCETSGGTTGCFKILGTLDSSVEPGAYEFTINVAVEGSLFGVTNTQEMSFPPISDDFFDNLFSFPLDPYAINVAAVSNENLLANELSMSENKPNPFATTTIIDVEAVKGGDYTFSVMNLLGEKVMSKEYNFATGKNTIEFDGSNLSNGVYIYSLSSDAGIISEKMIISK